MTTGIYRITFPDGSDYIGKSINVEERWRQHIDKMEKGTAAKPMQMKWDKYRDFKAELLIECHEDHIDILEETLIARLDPILNTSRPKDRMPGVYDEEFDTVIEYFKQSTLSHIENLVITKEELQAAKKYNDELVAQLMKIRNKRNEEELAADIENRISNLNDLVEELDSQLQQQDTDIAKLQKLLDEREAKIKELSKPWWKRLFS